MDLWDSGNQFGDEKINYLIFGSEIFIRQGNFAWRINTLIDNHSSDRLIYRQLLSFFQQQGNGNWWTIEAFLIEEKIKEANQKSLEQAENQKIAVSIGKEELNIKVPGTDGSWFKKNNFLIRGPQDSVFTLTKTNQETKEWSGIWVEDSSKPSQEIFQDIEVFIEKHENSQVFCKGNKCGVGIGKKYQISYQGTSKSASSTWNETYNTLTDTRNKSGDDFLRHEQGATDPILDFIRDSKGKWSDSKEICSAKNEEIDSDELKKLKVFCSKSNR